MSLVINPRNIIIEGGGLFDDSSDAEISGEEERFLEALRGLRGRNSPPSVRSDPARRRAGDGRTAGRSPRREGKESQATERRAKKPRRADPKAVGRLTVSTAASRARYQKKYVDQLEEMRREKKRAVPRPISPRATRAGLRLYAAAVGCQRRLEKLRKEQEDLRRQNEEKITFEPQISSFAKKMGSEGYVPPHERYNQTKEKLAKNILLREKKRRDRDMAGCTFHPTVEAASSKLVHLLRKNEPFSDVGERLFVDGGLRLIRQQLRERILEQKAENCVIGAFQISREASEEVALRLWKWKEKSDRNREMAQREYAEHLTKSSPLNVCHVSNARRSPQREHNNDNPLMAQPSLTTTPQLSSSSFSDANVLARTPVDELRRICYRALFLKYASSEKCLTVNLKGIKRQVRELFPEDSSVVVALSSDFSDTDDISKTAFVESLMRFEQLHGPQPWGKPRRNDVEPRFDERTILQPLPPPPPPPPPTSLVHSQRTAPGASTPGLRRCNSSSHVSPSKNKKIGKKDSASVRSSPLRRSSSAAPVLRCLSKVNTNCMRKNCERKDFHRNERKCVIQPKRMPNAGGCQYAEVAATDMKRRSLEQREKLLHQKQEEMVREQRAIPDNRPTAPKPLERRSLSPDSVEVSSITEDRCGSTPNAKRAEDVVAELEALIGTPEERSCTALPKRKNKDCSFDLHKGVSSSLPPSLRRPVRSVNVPGSKHGGGMGCSKPTGGGRPLTQQQLLKEVEEVLGVGTVSLAIDR